MLELYQFEGCPYCESEDIIDYLQKHHAQGER